MAKEISLTQNKVAIVDDEDYVKIARHNWRFKHGYAIRTVTDPLTKKRITLYMHHQIMGTSVSETHEIDHINGNRLDNRRDNLRLVTRQQNAFNNGVIKGSISRYKGVSWDKERNLWRAQIMINKRKSI